MSARESLEWELKRRRLEQLPMARGLDDASAVLVGVMLALLLAVVVRMAL